MYTQPCFGHQVWAPVTEWCSKEFDESPTKVSNCYSLPNFLTHFMSTSPLSLDLLLQFTLCSHHSHGTGWNNLMPLEKKHFFPSLLILLFIILLIYPKRRQAKASDSAIKLGPGCLTIFIIDIVCWFELTTVSKYHGDHYYLHKDLSEMCLQAATWVSETQVVARMKNFALLPTVHLLCHQRENANVMMWLPCKTLY